MEYLALTQTMARLPLVVEANPQKAKADGDLLGAFRRSRGLRRSEVAELSSSKGFPLTSDYYSKFERGERALEAASLDVRQGIRITLGISTEDWERSFGIYAPKTRFDEPMVQIMLPKGKYPSLSEIYQSDIWRDGDVFTASWTLEDGYITRFTEHATTWMRPEAMDRIHSLTVDPTRVHNELQIGVYGIKGTTTVLLSTLPSQATREFTYKHALDVKNENLQKISTDDLDYMGRMISGEIRMKDA